MKKWILGLCFLGIAISGLQAQKYFTREGRVSFYSDAPLEKIEAHNQKGTAVLDLESGRMEFAVLIKAFHFEKALMQEHFNENYMESNKYPKGVFKGKILNKDEIDFSKNGSYPATVQGEMTIHGETNELEADGKIIIKEGLISVESRFDLAVADYKIEIPSVVADNIAKIVSITVKAEMQPLDN